MNNYDIKLNMRMEVEMLINHHTEYLPTRVEGIDAGSITLSIPMWQGSLIRVYPKQKLSVRTFYHGSYYGFDTTVVERRLQPLPLLVVDYPQRIQRVDQRRKYVRVDARLPVRFHLLSDNNNDFSAYEAYTVNISAGGLLLSTEVPIKKGQELLVQIYLPEAGVTCKAKAVRVYKESDSLAKGRAALKYEDISEQDRDRIAGFVVTMQRELIKKGLLGA